MKKQTKVLGKGLQALIRENEIDLKSGFSNEVPIKDIISNKDQPRKKMAGIEKLAASIKERGVIQPIVVSETDGNKYQIIAGERRWRAAKLAGLEKMPIVLKKDIPSEDMLILGLIENLQREDLNPVEEAQAYKKLMDRYDISAEYLAKIFGKDRTTIINTVRLLNLPQLVQEDLKKGTLQPGHVRPLISLDNKKLVLELRNKIIKKRLSVRNVENLIKEIRGKGKKDFQPGARQKDTNLRSIEEKFQEKFTTKVRIVGSNNKGKIIIEYYSMDDLNRFMELMNIS